MKKNLISLIPILCIGTLSLHAQIEVHPNGTIHMGNTEVVVHDPPNTRFEVTLPAIPSKAIVRVPVPSNSFLIPPPLEFRGFQFMSSTDNNGFLVENIIVLAGLSNRTASIGRANLQMNRVYSAGYFSSNPGAGIQASSDGNLKTNIRELSSMIERVASLRPVMYDFVRSGSGEDVSRDPTYQNRVGFIAQEVEKLFPELVVKYTLGDEEDAEELLSLDYAGIIPYLTKVIQEQTDMLQEQARAIQEQNERIEKLEQQIGFATTFDFNMPNNAPQQSPTSAMAMQTQAESNILFQNVPNPFNSVTTINYRLADNVKSARICIYNLVGKQLQCYELPAVSGENVVEIRASSLQSGMYLYSLIVDGRLIDTKRMILTE